MKIYYITHYMSFREKTRAALSTHALSN